MNVHASMEVERSVLGALLVSSDARPAVKKLCAQGLRADHFYYRRHMEIWASMVALTDRDEPVDALTVAAELGRRGVAEDFKVCGGTTGYVHSLPTRSSSLANASAYADRVMELGALRQKRRAAHDLLEALSKEDYATVSEAEQRLTAIPLPGARSVPDRPLGVVRRREAA